MSYPIPVNKIAAKAPMMQWQHVESWASLHQMRLGQDRLDEMITRQAATAIAHEFTRDVLEQMFIERLETHEGLKVRFSCVALRRDQLLDLLYEAYREGQSDAQRYAPGVEVHPL